MKKSTPIKNQAASVRERLRQIREKTGGDFQLLMGRYATERLLYRLSMHANYKESFILKGALLFTIWHGNPHRITRDVDLLGFGESSIAGLENIFREICEVSVPDDGVTFDTSTIKAEGIRGQEAYLGIRVVIRAIIDKARIPLQIDIGFGDDYAVEPIETELPSLLGMPAPIMRTYRRETAIAEKFSALVGFGMLNTRMKDYYDFWFLAQHFDFIGGELSDSIRVTFLRRKNPLPAELPIGLTGKFIHDPSKQIAWRSFWKKSVQTEPVPELQELVSFVASFIWPAAKAAANGESFNQKWEPSGPWV